MNIAILLAGGVGSRMGLSVPKQYVRVFNKPIIVYTLEAFQNCPEIDAIEVVCEKRFNRFIKAEAEYNGISKLRWFASSGRTCQESTYNGVMSLQNVCKEEDIIIIHMSVSPLISCQNITEGIRVCKINGNAFPIHQNLIHLCKNIGNVYTDEYIDKDRFWALNMPWTMRYGELLSLYQYAYTNNIEIDEKSYLPSLMSRLGNRMFLYEDNQENRLKITNRSDLTFFKGYLLLKQSSQNQYVKRFQGIGASDGTIHSKVVVIDNSNDIHKVTEGDIVVVYKSSPAWVIPLIKASGVIAEIGGYVSHIAILSREMGKPCVTGIPNIFSSLIDGDEISINGQTGEVILYEQ